jgi:acyl transferase domain-containing protein/NADPH:quinone reductase-like Zn-dependent oxidoreductase/acyl carrier protein
MSEQTHNSSANDIAIIGLSCRLPGANVPDEFWTRICEGRELLTTFDDDELRDAGVSEPMLKDPQFVRVSGLIDGVGNLDAEFFRISPSEARLMDPQHRLFLELCWHALEDAGYTPDKCPQDIGVFGGGGRHAYLRYVEPHFTEKDYLDGSIWGLQGDIGNYGDFMATRVSYRLGLRGPSLNVQTACSTSLVSVHLACQSLLLGETDMALAGGVNLHTPQVNGYWYEEGSICSPDGRLRAFDARANGSVFGNGGGIVVLKRLKDAVADRDRIVAVIKASAINNDGSDKMSFTAPSVRGQADVIGRALRTAGVAPQEIGYIETHGTGTALGDPIEISGLISAFGLSDVKQPFCALGAVKSQIGHLGPAAGIAGLIKAALVVERGRIPPCANFEVPNPKLALEGSPFFIPKTELPWEGPRCAGVSAFGVGGTNAHIILAGAPELPEVHHPEEPLALVLSAATPKALEATRRRLARHLRATPKLALGDVAHVLATGRRTSRHRVALSAATLGQAAAALEDPQRWPACDDPRADLPVVFAFPGMGAQYPGAGAALYNNDATFRETVDTCARLLRTSDDFDIRDVLLPAADRFQEAAAKLRLARWGQPGVFVVEYALARSLLRAGIQPEVLIGHSLGEFAAACLAGVFSLEDALRLVAARGRLMNDTAPGAMMAIGLSLTEVLRILPPGLDVAAANAPQQTVVSGPIEAIAAFEDRFANTEVLHTVIGTSIAAHSSLMDPIVEDFRKVVASVRLSAPRMAIASTLTGTRAGAAGMAEQQYWVRHLREPVRFMSAAKEAAQDGPAAVIEVGPGRACARMFVQSDGDQGSATVTPLIPKEREPQSAADVVAAVWSQGGRVDWAKHLADHAPRRVALPGYPFERNAVWIDPPRTDKPMAAPPPLRPAAKSLLQVPSWRPTPLSPPEKVATGRRILALVSASDSPVVRDLRAAGHTVVEIAIPKSRGNSEEPALRLGSKWELGPIDTVVVIASSSSGKVETQVAEVLDSAFWPSLAVVRAAARERGTESLDFIVVTSGRHLLHGDSTLCPELAVLAGPARVLPQEYPNVRVTEVDFAISEPAEVIARTLSEELRHPAMGATIAYRSDVRHVMQYLPVAQTVGMRPWVESGSYLITGGLGGIGLAMAEEASRTPGVRLTLTYRTPLPEVPLGAVDSPEAHMPPELAQRLACLTRVRTSGATVHLVQADVTDDEAMKRVRAEFGPFTGIIHAAGVPSGHLIETLDRSDADKVFAPKVKGALVLHEHVADQSTEWMLLCSSVSAVVGGVGHVDYCSANAFIDAFAAWRTNTGHRTISLAYDAWAEVGMAAKEAARSTAARLLSGCSPRARLRPLTHPLFTHEWYDGDTSEYHGTFRKGVHWVVDEHCVAGSSLLPGTAIIECLRAAAARRLGVEQIRLTEVDLVRPLVVTAGEGTRFAVVMEGGGAELKTALMSRSPGAEKWTQNAVARVCTGSLKLSSDPSKRPSAGEVLDPRRVLLESRAISLGPRWNNVVRLIRPHESELIVECELADEFIEDTKAFGVHPALLDTAAGSFLPLLDEGTFLPISYERIDIHCQMPRRIRSHVVRRKVAADDLMTFDVLVQDEACRPVVELEGYSLRRTKVDEIAGTLAQKAVTSIAAPNRRLVSTEAGDLGALRFVPANRRLPDVGEVEIQVRASGLNFKEVLIAAGMLDSGMPDFPFGFECAGVVRAVGQGVTQFQEGDAVMAIGSSCFSDFVCVQARLVRAIPEGLTFAQAATVPIAFTTAYECLVNLANLQAGERALVHAVTGGVGMAAAQLAIQLGATVFGTASSEEKRQAARKAGVQLVMDSRSTAFEEQTVAAGGVDVVLNSLAGDFIPAGLRTLRPRGRFVELGRRDIVGGSVLGMDLFAPGRAFMSYYPEPGSSGFEQAFGKVVDLLAAGKITPLPLHTFAPSDASAAFLFMSKARHVGKVLVVRDGAEEVVGRTGTGERQRDGITAAIGLRALRGAIALGSPHVLVSPRPVGTVAQTEMMVAEHALERLDDGPMRARAEMKYEFVAPEGDTETRLGHIWSTVLSVERVGREDRFLDLGGDSLHATQVAARIRSDFGIRMAPSSLLGDRPLRDLAKMVEEHIAKPLAS